MKKAVIIGASSGIGKALAVALAKEGIELGLAARRFGLLEELQRKLGVKTWIKQVDVAETEEASQAVEALIEEMGGVDLFIVNAGVFRENDALAWSVEKETIQINVFGFAAMASLGMRYFLRKGKGHLVAISSVSANRGSPLVTAYCASKAFVSHYMEGLRIKAFRDNCNIFLTDVQPGWVDTDMLKGRKGLFWVTPADKAARQILEDVKRRRYKSYVSRRWRFFVWLMKLSPRWLYDRYLY